MNRYKSFTVEEFAMDETFRQWVIAPSAESDQIWNDWLIKNPDKVSATNQAKDLVMGIKNVYDNSISDEMVNSHIREITRLAELRKAEKTGKSYSFPFSVWRAVAAVLLAIGLGWFYYSGKNVETRIAKATERPIGTNVEMVVKSNNSSEDMTILLSDNSVATLKKGSTISYPSHFEGNERKVSLSGEAFFDITRNPEKPFLVFANETVTKVLGTSFRVKAFDQENTVMVVVKTGIVSVYPKREYETLSHENDNEVSGVVLNPNQKVVFIRNQNRLEKGIVANPEMLNELAVPKDLIFDDKPVSEVFETLEGIYGIDIIFDEKTLTTCIINAQFSEENLKQRMNAICQAIGATYEMVDGRIVINSRGCSL